MPNYSLFSGKQISILGDSISTLKGFLPTFCKSFYMQNPHADCSGISRPEDTWWVQVISELGGNICVNNSYSGSMVCGMDFPSATHLLRCKELHCNPGAYHFPLQHGSIQKKLCTEMIIPDVILVTMGANDWIFRSVIEEDLPEKRNFRFAYDKMLQKLKAKYPESFIICATIFQKDDAVCNARYPVAAYNSIIRSTAAKYGCRIADLAQYDDSIETIDGIHPTYQGMRTLAKLWMRCLTD